MHHRMAPSTQGNQVLLGIFAAVAPKFFVVHVQVRHRAARLTSPAITKQDLLAQSLIGQRIQPYTREF
jgi:hypothetical protein